MLDIVREVSTSGRVKTVQMAPCSFVPPPKRSRMDLEEIKSNNGNALSMYANSTFAIFTLLGCSLHTDYAEETTDGHTDRAVLRCDQFLLSDRDSQAVESQITQYQMSTICLQIIYFVLVPSLYYLRSQKLLLASVLVNKRI